MAAEDMASYKQDDRQAKTAHEVLVDLNVGQLSTDVENDAAAEAAGVKDVHFINYGEALEAYEARSDIESLAHRRARDFPEDFDDASFMREVGTPAASEAN